MPDGLAQLLTKLKDHFPDPPASPLELARFEASSGITLPEDIRRFFAAADGACFFQEDDPPFRILSIAEWTPVCAAILGEPNLDLCPSEWIAICDVRDGNYLAMDFSRPNLPVLDCFHETFAVPGHRNVIAMGFTELLALILASDGKKFYLAKEFKGHGYV